MESWTLTMNYMCGNASLAAALTWETETSLGVYVLIAGGQTSKRSKPSQKAHVNVLMTITAC